MFAYHIFFLNMNQWLLYSAPPSLVIRMLNVLSNLFENVDELFPRRRTLQHSRHHCWWMQVEFYLGQYKFPLPFGPTSNISFKTETSWHWPCIAGRSAPGMSLVDFSPFFQLFFQHKKKDVSSTQTRWTINSPARRYLKPNSMTRPKQLRMKKPQLEQQRVVKTST